MVTVYLLRGFDDNMSIDLLSFKVGSFMVLFSLALWVFAFIKGPQDLTAKILAMVFFTLLFIASLLFSIFTGLAAIEWHRISRGGESYIKTEILASENHEFINWSKETTQEEKEQSLTVLEEIPSSDYRIVLHDYYYCGLEYMVYFNENDVVFIALETPRLFYKNEVEKPEYSLRIVEKPINGKVSFRRYKEDEM